MGNIRTWLEAACEESGEKIEAIVVGRHDNAWNGTAAEDENVILPVEQALKKLDVEFDNGYGGADCFPIWAWTKSRVYFIGEYDGATGLSWVPRHPVAGEPSFSGN